MDQTTGESDSLCTEGNVKYCKEASSNICVLVLSVYHCLNCLRISAKYNSFIKAVHGDASLRITSPAKDHITTEQGIQKAGSYHLTCLNLHFLLPSRILIKMVYTKFHHFHWYPCLILFLYVHRVSNHYISIIFITKMTKLN